MQAVERPPATQRPDDVADRLGDEQHADRAEVRTRPLTQLAQGRPEEADRQPDDEESGEVQRRGVDGDHPWGDGGRGAPCAHYGMPHGTFAQWLVPPTTPLTTTPPAEPRRHEGSIRGSVLGTRVLRTEDPGSAHGQRRYVADLQLEGTAAGRLRPLGVAHGTISAIHIEDAVGMPGVVAVLTAAELGVAPHHGFMQVHDDFARPPLADDRVRFVGEAIAVVLAETYEQGEDAAARCGPTSTRCPP